jgi:hypothetical protein
VALEEVGAHRVTLRADPARARHGPSGGIGSRCKRSRTAFASQNRSREYWVSLWPPGRGALERNAPESVGTLSLSMGNPQWYGKPLKQLGLLSRQADIRRVTGASRVNLRHQARSKRRGYRALVHLVGNAMKQQSASYPDAEIRGLIRRWKEELARLYGIFERAYQNTRRYRRAQETGCVCRIADPPVAGATAMYFVGLRKAWMLDK